MDNNLGMLLQETLKSASAAAMLLALTRNLHDEEVVKKSLTEVGYKFMVTEVGGKIGISDFQERINKAIIGAGLNGQVIEKNAREVHALVHAAEEAKRGMMINASSSSSLALKIAIVRSEHWISVAMFGKSALHYTTNHHRAGLGVMHI